MKMFNDFYSYLSKITSIDKIYYYLIFNTIILFIIFIGIRKLIRFFVSKRTSGRKEFLLTQSLLILSNVLEVICIIFIWDEYIKSLMTLISVITAAMTIALKDIILNFFCGIYIKIKKPFKVEDRIIIDDLKGDVMNISSLDFEILEISNEDSHGQSTGVVISIPNSYVFSKPLKNITKGFKYVWDEITVKVTLDCDLAKNKQEIYKIVNNIETIKTIPKKMKDQVDSLNNSNRIYFNQYNPIIYTKIVDNHVELTVRYLMHPKKSRYIESVIWNKLYTAYKDGKLNLFIG